MIDNPPRYKGEIYPELLIGGVEPTFESHRNIIWDEARRYLEISKIAKEKGIILTNCVSTI
mgnify:CR=1 FL=1